MTVSSNCDPCPKGDYCATTGLIVVTGVCAAGRYSNAGASACRNCATGTFQPQKGSSICLKCPIGRFQSKYGALLCDACAQGFFQKSIGQSSCDFTFAPTKMNTVAPTTNDVASVAIGFTLAATAPCTPTQSALTEIAVTSAVAPAVVYQFGVTSTVATRRLVRRRLSSGYFWDVKFRVSTPLSTMSQATPTLFGATVGAQLANIAAVVANSTGTPISLVGNIRVEHVIRTSAPTPAPPPPVNVALISGLVVGLGGFAIIVAAALYYYKRVKRHDASAMPKPKKVEVLNTKRLPEANPLRDDDDEDVEHSAIKAPKLVEHNLSYDEFVAKRGTTPVSASALAEPTVSAEPRAPSAPRPVS